MSSQPIPRVDVPPAVPPTVPSPDYADDSLLSSQDLAFRARALAQAHALSEAAHRYRAWRIDRDRPDHPIPELSTWAATAFLTGYCIRCVEESWPTGSTRPPRAGPRSDNDFETWERLGNQFANDLPTNPHGTLLVHTVVVAAIDDVIDREVDKRAEHVKEQVSAAEWTRFHDFVGWWVVHGYSIRAVET